MKDILGLELEKRPRKSEMDSIMDDMILCDKKQDIMDEILETTPCGLKRSTRDKIYCPIGTYRECNK